MNDQNLWVNETSFNGSAEQKEFKLQFWDYGRKVQIQTDYLATSNKSSSYDGLIGIEPPYAFGTNYSSSFLYKLKESGIINHLIVSAQFNLNESSLKFGSWDKYATQEDSMKFHSTRKSSSWALQASSMTF